MARLGKYLQKRGWASAQAVQSALASQAAGGGRLGTNLLDSNVLTEDQLTRALAEVHRLPGAGAEDLRGVPDEVIALLPAKVARRVGAVPFKAFGTQVHVALADPDNLAAQDEVVFAVGKRVVFYVAPEVRVAEALERYYGEPCSSRVASLVDRLNRTRFLWDRPESPAEGQRPEWSEPATALFTPAPRLPTLPPPLPSPPTRPTAPAPPVARMLPALPPPVVLPPAPRAARPPAPTVVTVSETERFALQQPESAPPAVEEAPAPIVVPSIPLDLPPPVRTVDEAVARLESARDAEAIGAVLIEFLGREFDRVALFKAFGDRVEGWLGSGADLDVAALEAYVQRLDEPSVFLNLRTGGSYVLGSLPRMPAHRRLAALWGAVPGGIWCFLPLRIHGRLVSVIALERGGQTPRPTDIEGGLAVSTAAALAFERCILRRKKE